MSVPSPLAGLNVRDSLAAMDPRFAIQLDNFWPTGWGVFVRRGWSRWASLPTPVEVQSLLNYARTDGSENLFAVANDHKIYDVTLPTSSAPTVPYAPPVGPYVESVNFTNVFGTFLICVSGGATPFHYNGVTWAALNITGVIDDGPPVVDLDPADLVDVEVFKRRLWFVEKNSTRAWYLPTDSIQGVAELFDLGEVFPRGGYLAEIASWSVDTGEGLNDKLVFVSSEGDIALFSGIDPDQDFSLDGLFRIGAPINRRSAVKRGGDLVIATREGVVSMAAVLQEQSEGGATTITDVIKPLLSALGNNLTNIEEWQLVMYNRIEMLLYNTSDSAGINAQYAMNTTTKAWTRFVNMLAKCWGVLEGVPHFGGAGYVARFWVGAKDGSTVDLVGGETIQAQAIQAYSYFDSSGRQKHWRMARPILRGGSEPNVGIALMVDYSSDNPTYALDPTPLGYGFGIWDVSYWDAALWGANAIPFLRWYNVGAIGMAGAIAISVKCATPDMAWISTDLVYESGGVL